jgi:hypothetical protein
MDRPIFRRGATTLCALLLALLGAACGDESKLPTEGEPLAGATVTLVNFDSQDRPVVRFDVNGNMVDAHGGEIRWFENKYYLYAETYGCGFEWHKLAPAPFCGFRVYSSPNLVEWTDHGLLFDVSQWEPWQRRCNWWTSGCFRPHVLYNESTRKYVLWVNSYDDPVNYYVLESASPTGPFVERALPKLAYNTNARGGNVNNGDENLFVDEDGTAYIVYAEWAIGKGDLVVERLTPDYLSGTGQHVRVGVRQNESPSLFKRGGRYYITASTPPNAAYGTSVTSYYTAPSPLGPWSAPRQLNFTSCGGQPAHVSQLPTPDGKSWYLYQSDLWINSDGRESGDLNQAPAPQYWAPLSFDATGEILPFDCERTVKVTTAVAAAPARQPDARRLQCDVAAPAGGRRVMREFRFAAPRSGQARSLSVATYQRGEPTGPLVVELRGTGADSGTVLHRASVDADAGNWDVPVNISWAARKLDVPLSAALQAGRQYAVRVQSATAQGCYGFAYMENAPAGAASAWVSTDGGAWTAEAGQGVQVDVAFTGS